MWRANPKPWVSRLERVNLIFGPDIKKYLQENHLHLLTHRTWRMTSMKSSSLQMFSSLHPTPPLSCSPWTSSWFLISRRFTPSTCSHATLRRQKAQTWPLESSERTTITVWYASELSIWPDSVLQRGPWPLCGRTCGLRLCLKRNWKTRTRSGSGGGSCIPREVHGPGNGWRCHQRAQRAEELTM